MDNVAIGIVERYIIEQHNESVKAPRFLVYITWKAKILQNWKYLLASTLSDGMYYELTYSGFTANADFNASQNLAIPFIDEIIEEVKPSKKYKKVG